MPPTTLPSGYLDEASRQRRAWQTSPLFDAIADRGNAALGAMQEIGQRASRLAQLGSMTAPVSEDAPAAPAVPSWEALNGLPDQPQPAQPSQPVESSPFSMAVPTWEQLTGQKPAASSAPAPAPARPQAASGVPVAMPQGANPETVARIANAGTRASRYAEPIARIAAEEDVDPEGLAALVDTEDSDENSTSVDGARGLLQVVPGQGFDRPGEDASDPETSIRQGARAYKEKIRMAGGDTRRAGGLYFGQGTDSLGNTSDVYQQKFDANRARYGASPNTGAVGDGSASVTRAPAAPAAPSQSSAAGAGAYSGPYTQQSLADAGDPDAWSKCGPVAAFQAAAVLGRNPTPAEVERLAKQYGWTAEKGMAGLQSEANLLNGMNIAAHAVTGRVDWNAVIADVQRGNPVLLQLPGHEGHYITAQSYDPQTGKIDFGSTVGDLTAAGHRTKMTPDELEGIGWGIPNGALFIDNPATPTPSVVAGGSNYKLSDTMPADEPGLSPGDQKRTKLAAMRGEQPADEPMPTSLPPDGRIVYQDPDNPQPMPGSVYRNGWGPEGLPGLGVDETGRDQQTGRGVGQTPWLGDDESIYPITNPALNQRQGQPQRVPRGGEMPGLHPGPEVMYRQPLAPTMGADTTTGDYDPRDADQGPGARELPDNPVLNNPPNNSQDNLTPPSTYAASSDAPGQVPVQPAPQTEQPGPIQQAISWAGGKLLPIVNEAGETLGYLHANQQANQQAVVDANAGQQGGVNFGQGARNLADVLPEPAIEGMVRTQHRMREIEQQAGGMQMALSDPTWRAANPELAQEYDDLNTDAILTFGGMAGAGGPKFTGPTVEVLEQRLTQAQNLVQRLLGSGDSQRLAAAQDARAAVESQLVDAKNARASLEPRIRSDVGAKEQAVPPSEQTIENRLESVRPVERGTVAPEDLSGPVSIPTDVGSRLNATPGVSPAVAGVLGDVANSIGGGVAGAAVGAGLPADTPEERLQHGLIGAGAGMIAGPVAGRLMRRGEGALATPGVGPNGRAFDRPNRPPNLGDVPPSQIHEPVMPGFEDVPARRAVALPGSVGDAAAQREMRAGGTALPGMEREAADRFAPVREAQMSEPVKPSVQQMPLTGTEHIDPLTDPTPFIPPNERSLLPSNSLQTPGAVVENVLRQEQAQARRLARASMTKPEGVQPGQASLPTLPPNPSLAERIRTATEPWSRRVNIMRYAGMLSDSATQIFNLTSNALLQGLDVAATPVAAALDIGRAAITGKPRQVFFSEVPARIAGMRAGAKVGLQNAAEILRTGLTPVDAAKQLEGGSAGFASGSGAVDFAFEAPLRALAASDAVFRTMAQGGHLAAEGMAAAMKASPGTRITPDLLREAMKDPALLEKAQKLGARTVLQEDRVVTQAYQKFLQAVGPEARAAISTELPFVKTPYNVVAQGVGLTPAGLLGVVQDMAEHKPARDIEYRVARVALGTAVMAGAAADYASGNLTGPRPTDPKELSTLPPGWQPWSRKIPLPGGGTYYLPLALLGPLALPPVAAILMGEAAKKGGDATARAGRVALGVGQYAAQNTMFQSLSNIGGLLDQRDAEHNIERNVQQVVSQFSPHIIGGGALGREIQRIMGMPMRDPNGALEALLATHPLTAGRVEPRQDVLGRPSVPYVSGPIAAVARVGRQQDAGVIQAFRAAREGLPLAAPKQIRDTSTDQMVTLTPRQQHQWRRVFGAALQEDWSMNGNPQEPDALRRIEARSRQAADQTLLGLR